MMTDSLTNIVVETWAVLGQMSPYLLFGFLVAGVLSVCISPELVQRHLGGRGFGPVLKAALFGVPLPLCSCGVIPVAAAFRRHGASRGATTSFLLSTPQTGVDSIAVTYALLGLAFAIYRPLAALVTGLVGGMLVMLFAEPSHGSLDAEPKTPQCTGSCCADKERRHVVRRALHYGFVVLPSDIGVALLVGVVIAGIMSATVHPNQWQAYLGGGVLSYFLMMALGVPLYVCASASVPIAAGLIHVGASPGAALAFLIAGPATNAATITTVWKLLGRQTAILYLLTIAISAVGGGMLLDWLVPTLRETIAETTEHCHGEHVASGFAVETLSAVLLLGILAYSYAAKSRAVRRHTHGHDDATGREHPPMTIELAVTGLNCEHCVAAVREALRKCSGVASAQVDLASGRATIVGDGLDRDELIKAVTAAGYQAATRD